MALPVMVILQEEIQDWLRDDPRVINHISRAYKECISSCFSPLTHDPRFLINNHIVNMDFINNPQFIVGYHHLAHTVLAVLYVYPSFRRQGIGTHLINTMQQANCVIQVAVDARQRGLGKLYSNNGFKTLGNEVKDDLGVTYVDYFWSPRPFNLEQTRSGTDIIPA